MNKAPKLREIAAIDRKLEMIKLKREAELYLGKIKEKLKDKKVLKKAALLIEEMIKSDDKKIPPSKK
jgi:hypothetical protein